MSIKTFVLDTNVLIHDPEALLHFKEHRVVLPMEVIEELDGLKRGKGEVSLSARQALRLIDSFRENGNINSGVPLPEGGQLRVVESGKVSDMLDGSSDNRIISVAHRLAEDDRNIVILVSKDTAVRIKAEALKIPAQDYRSDKTTVFAKYGQVMDESVPHCNGIHSLRFLSSEGQLYAVNGAGEERVPVRVWDVLGIKPRNAEQRCALYALTLQSARVVALTGKAGTGKTLLALAAGIMQTGSSQPGKGESYPYEQVMVARPIAPMAGNDIGFLPGVIEEKMAPWMEPIHDNLDILVRTPPNTKVPKGQPGDKPTRIYKSADYLVESGLVKLEPLTYIRGRSLPNRFMIIDECQNLRPVDVKTIITRCGEGTKIVFTGDLDQIDNPYLDKYSNGLSYLISRFIDQSLFCYLNLQTSVRSELAELAATLL